PEVEHPILIQIAELQHLGVITPELVAEPVGEALFVDARPFPELDDERFRDGKFTAQLHVGSEAVREHISIDRDPTCATRRSPARARLFQAKWISPSTPSNSIAFVTASRCQGPLVTSASNRGITWPGCGCSAGRDRDASSLSTEAFAKTEDGIRSWCVSRLWGRSTRDQKKKRSQKRGGDWGIACNSRSRSRSQRSPAPSQAARRTSSPSPR